MPFTNYEIKARSSEEQQNKIREILRERGAKFMGIDNQKDTYFKTENNRERFKLRRGNIENYAIFYKRENKADPKKSEVILIDNQGRISELENRAKRENEVLCEVEKQREIYFISNVKFHLDYVKSKALGYFVEIEASSCDNSIPEGELEKQCEYYKNLFRIEDKSLIVNSYSDMV